MKTNNECCAKCMFWKENQYRGMASLSEELVMGKCHRNPPSTDGHLSFFPETKSTEWCGECSVSKKGKKK